MPICLHMGTQRTPMVLNHMIAEGECKQSWFTCFHKYFWSKSYTSVWRKILEIRIKRITEIRHGMRKLIIFLWILGHWILKLGCTQGLNNMVSHQHFLKLNFKKFRWKQMMQKTLETWSVSFEKWWNSHPEILGVRLEQDYIGSKTVG